MISQTPPTKGIKFIKTHSPLLPVSCIRRIDRVRFGTIEVIIYRKYKLKNSSEASDSTAKKIKIIKLARVAHQYSFLFEIPWKSKARFQNVL